CRPGRRRPVRLRRAHGAKSAGRALSSTLALRASGICSAPRGSQGVLRAARRQAGGNPRGRGAQPVDVRRRAPGLHRGRERPRPARTRPRRAGMPASAGGGKARAHLTGSQHFMGLELLAGPQALIPRRETEILGRAALAFLRALPDASLLAVDVCTGSGNLALALARHEPRVRVVSADLSPEAIPLAQRNAAITRLRGGVEFHVGDLFAPLERLGLEGSAALICCNPPYITRAKVPRLGEEISAHEPHLAFDGGAIGLNILRRLFLEAPAYLRPGGALCVEIGLGQGPALQARLARRPWVERVQAHCDVRGAIRALSIIRR